MTDAFGSPLRRITGVRPLSPTITVVIPTLNEERNVERLPS
jgi:hypothetical protein